ncbi:UDP-N-acetyl-D-mannosaminuronic acid transferase [Streptomyces sp. RB5]|uniref:UDP-N-acetyl-D-mannosaminuronic acid transferase n=1 Tax=Streptomyces smaragdinus TaxID=2585196 RepID=A0A7K0CLM2_9ACTN|nr:WecB/TagA/CpsF family glycosyltransferase [Streptomyces smaragdinus]MQY14385.1 UDP-N-acetyl-D-mannosaminuronic acid transferase [Streptomyces smaragdinus]
MTARRTLFGVELDALTMDETVERCVTAARNGHTLEIGVVNAAKLVNMRRDPSLAEAVQGCDLVLADGQAVVWASRLLRAPLPERVAGIDLFVRLLREAEKQGLSVYFLGARREVLTRMLHRVARKFPALAVAGSRDGYFGDDEQPAVADAIARSGAQLLFLGMTSPKKEIFTAGYGRRSGARVIHGVGGSFDILAGVTRRAPERWQRLGLEWLYRLLQEPRRLGRRYLTTNAVFVGMTLRELFRRRPLTSTAGRGI